MGFMVTNRAINESKQATTLPRPITFKLADSQPLQSLFFCDVDDAGNAIEIGSDFFFNTLKNLPFEHLLMTIHGFNTSPSAALANTKRMQTLFDAKMPGKVGVLPLIWACEISSVNIAERYLDDQLRGDASGIAFARLFMMFLEWRDKNSTLTNPCMIRISMLAHSMGNRVLRQAVRDLQKVYGYYDIPKVFKHIFMVAADLTNQTLEKGEDGEKLPYICDHLCVYSAMDDLALRSSKVANTMSVSRPIGRRLGHTGTENLSQCPKNVYDFGCSDFNTKYDNPLGHTYFITHPTNAADISPVFTHIQETIANKKPKTKLDSNGQAIRTNVLPIV